MANTEPERQTERFPETAATAQNRSSPEWSSQQLLGDAHEARILHGNEVYRLIRTRNDKLILVK